MKRHENISHDLSFYENVCKTLQNDMKFHFKVFQTSVILKHGINHLTFHKKGRPHFHSFLIKIVNNYIWFVFRWYLFPNYVCIEFYRAISNKINIDVSKG